MGYVLLLTMILLLIVVLYSFFVMKPIIEPMVFHSNNMKKNIYNKYNITIYLATTVTI